MPANRKAEVDAAVKDVDFSKNTYQVELDTTKGKILLDLWPDVAPGHVKNMIGLAKIGFYDGVIFHRVISGFMIQGGDPLGNGTGGPGYEFADEFHPDLAFDRPYLVAMANAGPNTNGSQFFVTVAPTTWLTRKHSIFGEVADEASKKVVDSIVSTPTNPRTDRPLEDVVIQTITVTRTG
jgi:peptidyl-prolyl cis-trans isomerase A (cyclophilin A)